MLQTIFALISCINIAVCIKNITKIKHDIPWDVTEIHQIYLTIDDYLNFMDKDPDKQDLIMIFIANNNEDGYVIFDVNELMDKHKNERLDTDLYLLPLSMPVHIFKTGKECMLGEVRRYKAENPYYFNKGQFRKITEIQWLSDLFEENEYAAPFKIPNEDLLQIRRNTRAARMSVDDSIVVEHRVLSI